MEINLREELISLHLAVYKAKVLRDDLIEEHPSQGGFDGPCLHSPVGHGPGHTHFDLGVECQGLVLIGQDSLIYILEEFQEDLKERELKKLKLYQN